MRWKFSHLKNTSAPVRSSTVREVITGVRCARPASRSAAAATSAYRTARAVSFGAFIRAEWRRFSRNSTPRLRLANTPAVDQPDDHAEHAELQQIVRGLEDEPGSQRRHVLLAGLGEHRDARHQDTDQQPELQ